jgi:hypothetical protein
MSEYRYGISIVMSGVVLRKATTRTIRILYQARPIGYVDLVPWAYVPQIVTDRQGHIGGGEMVLAAKPLRVSTSPPQTAA